MIFGPIMIVAPSGCSDLDSLLERAGITGAAPPLPAGLILLLLLLTLIALGSRELHRIFQAKGILTDTVLLGLAGAVGAVLIYIVPPQWHASLALTLYATGLAVVFAAAMVRHSWGGARRV